MISYEFYKFFHLGFIFLLIAFFYGDIPTGKKEKFARLVVYFLVFAAGMGLIARLGFKHSEPFPTWIRLKFVMLFLLGSIHFAKWNDVLSQKISKRKLNLIFFVGLIFTLLIVQSKWH